MSEQSLDLAWAAPGWSEDATTWIRAELARRGLSITGAIQLPHARPWSAVLRVPTSTGDVYFKATAPSVRYEVALTAALAGWHPALMPNVLAADRERGWLLIADGGTRLREIIRADHDLRHWEALLPRYAELQIDLASRSGELLGMGTPDRRLAVLPDLYRELLSDHEILRVGKPDGLTDQQFRRLRELVPHVAALCARLDSYGIPATLHHGDFHDGNIFAVHGQYRFFDWGDACVTHPFVSLRTAFVSIEISLDLAEDAPEFARLRDAYLEPWAYGRSRDELRAAFELSRQGAAIVGALGWHRVVASLGAQQREEYAEPVPALLQEFLDLSA